MWVVEKPRQPILVHAPGRGEATVLVKPAQTALLHPAVDQPVAGAGVEGGDAPLPVDQGDIGDAADVQDGEGRLKARRLRPGDVIDGRERRAMAACRDVSGAEVEGDGPARKLREQCAVAELAGAARPR